jgi:thiamine biosynthesis protein ThiS
LRIKINGEFREVADRLSIDELITDLKLAGSRLAIELNHAVIRRAEWPNRILQEDDRVEIVHFVGGG